MKQSYTIFLLGLLISHSTLLPAQNYIDSTSIWYEEYGAADGLHYYKDLNTYFIDGDTVLSGKTYYQLYWNQIDSVWDAFTDSFQTVNINSHIYQGGIREDAQKRFYMMYPGQSAENLMFDFNLNIGDPLPNTVSNYNCNTPPNTVTGIDTVYLGSTPIKRFHFPPGLFNKTLYEGIGSSGGLIWFGSLCQAYHAGGCIVAYKKGVDSLYIGCNQSATALSEISVTQPASVYPNPADDFFSLKTPSAVHGVLSMYDVFGKLVLTKELISNKDQVSVCTLAPGFYFWNLTATNNRISGGQITISHP